MNKVMLIGRLGKDPELRYASTGTPMTTLRIATDDSYTDRDGNKVDRTEWHSVVVFQRQAENCAKYLSKGSLVYVEGSLQTRKWQDQQGQDRYTTEVRATRIQFLDRKDSSSRVEDNSHNDSPYKSQSAKTSAIYGSGVDDVDEAFGVFPSEASKMDEIPF
jgi:single-strand DNA-binding protein